MLQLNKSKEVLERLLILMTTRQSSGMNVLSELMEIGDKVQDAINEIDQAEIDAARATNPLRRLEAKAPLRVRLFGRREGA
jgi:hypothetical protein